MPDEAENGVLTVVDKVAPEGWKKYVGKVMFQLGLGTSKAASLYESGRETIDTAEGRSIVNQALARAVAEQAVKDPEVMERAKARFLGKIVSEQENLEAVLRGAERKLLALPPPNISETEETDYTDANGKGTSSGDDILGSDWAASFTRQAELATTEELREILSQILSKEIQKPGTHPKSVFRSIIELEKADIEVIRKALPFRRGGEVFTGAMDESFRADAEKTFREFNFQDTAMVSRGGFFFEAGSNNIFRSLIMIEGGYALFVQSENAYVRSDVIILTKKGESVCDILDELDSLERLERFGDQFMKDGFRTWLVAIVPGQGISGEETLVHFTAIRLLHDGLPLHPPGMD